MVPLGVFRTQSAKVSSEPSPKFQMGLFAKIFNGPHLLIVFAEQSIFDVWLGSECVSEMSSKDRRSEILIFESVDLPKKKINFLKKVKFTSIKFFNW